MKKASKLILKELRAQLNPNSVRRTWRGHLLPFGWIDTGDLHRPEVGGTGTRARITECRQRGIDIDYRQFTHYDLENKVMSAPIHEGIIQSDLDGKLSNRFIHVRDDEGEIIHCHAYKLNTDPRLIDFENCKLKAGTPRKFTQQSLEF